jgi:hypothetical protein
MARGKAGRAESDSEIFRTARKSGFFFSQATVWTIEEEEEMIGIFRRTDMSINQKKRICKKNSELGENWDDKLRILHIIDALREEARKVINAGPEKKCSSELESLREKLRVYENTCAMLEREVQELEQQTLAALAEAGRLRRELDRREADGRDSDSGVDEKIQQVMAEAENERRLLLDALENSEAELANMVKTLDQVARKLQVA